MEHLNLILDLKVFYGFILIMADPPLQWVMEVEGSRLSQSEQ